ncbi:MAG TPA: alanine--tRNA ligase [Anaerolineae bacterium]|nr:alanine--tRNA ligase [Anaerolineae bacterium]
MTSSEIRELFLRFFEKNGHTRVLSSPVIPWGDPTLLFTNAGMNQFKDVFLGLEKREYARATTCQKCIRAGGKHNDLDEVGRTTRHGTFLEMLGNFSFGDYFKEEAIGFAWEFMIKEMGFSPDELLVSVYTSDDEAFFIWNNKIGIPKNRILRFGNLEKGDEENFWSMGITGPCGPCSEIYIDRGSEYGPDDPYAAIAIDAPRFIELWNLVFMQFNRDETGSMIPLQKPSIDTGLGLERIAMIIQGKENIFETDILGKLVKRIEELTGITYDESIGLPFRVVADHVRTLTFAIADGTIPSNEGRGYVIRRILRRASRYIRKLNVHETILFRLVSDVADLMGDAYPEITERAEYISMVIKGEEERFLKTLDQGVDLFERLVRDVRTQGGHVIGGDDAFKLYDTYGFPVDLTRIMAEEQGMTVDMDGFEKAMEVQRIRAREASAFVSVKDDETPWIHLGDEKFTGSIFLGYDSDTVEANLIRYRLDKKGTIELVFDKTPFYVLSGGQVSDTGMIVPSDNSFKLQVRDVYDYHGVGRVHICHVIEGTFSPDALKVNPATLTIDSENRRDTERNHTATHLLQAGLQKVLGMHVRQAGSVVSPQRLRFDFNHFLGMTKEELESVEEFINKTIIENYQVTVRETTLEDARKIGAMSLFEEKYGEIVRLVKVNTVSLELCGGTHVSSTGCIGLFRIISESSVAAGIRRIEAVTGMRAYDLARKERDVVTTLSQRLNAASDEIVERIEDLAEKVRDLEREVKRLRTQGPFGRDDILSQVVEVKGIKVVFKRVDVIDINELKLMADNVRDRIGSGVGVLGTAVNGKVTIVVTVTDDLIAKHSLNANDIVKKIAKVVDGSGGGRPHLAMVGGKDVSKLEKALASAPSIVEHFLS